MAAADSVEYDVILTSSVGGMGGIDIHDTDNTYWRDCNSTTCGTWQDQNGLGGHPATDITSRALNTWYHRRLAVPQGATSYVGKTIAYVDLVDESDTKSQTATAYYDNVIVSQIAGACDGAGVCRRKSAASCSTGTDCASGVCTGSVCQ